MADFPFNGRQLLLTAGALPAVRPAFAQQEGARALVVLFTRTHNSRVAAELIVRRTGAAFFEIEAREPYPVDYFETVDLNHRQQIQDIRPPLVSEGPDLAAYDVIYLAHPIWDASVPPPVKTFLAAHDFTGKALVPVISHGGYGSGRAREQTRALAPGAALQPAFVMEDQQERRVITDLDEWLLD